MQMQPKRLATIRITAGAVIGVLAVLYGLYVTLPTFAQDLGETMRLNADALESEVGVVTEVKTQNTLHVVTGTKRVTVTLVDGRQSSRDSRQYIPMNKGDRVSVGLHNDQLVTINGQDVRSPVNLIIMFEMLLLGVGMLLSAMVTTRVIDAQAVLLAVASPVVTIVACIIERQLLELALLIPLYCFGKTLYVAHMRRRAAHTKTA